MVVCVTRESKGVEELGAGGCSLTRRARSCRGPAPWSPLTWAPLGQSAEYCTPLLPPPHVQKVPSAHCVSSEIKITIFSCPRKKNRRYCVHTHTKYVSPCAFSRSCSQRMRGDKPRPYNTRTRISNHAHVSVIIVSFSEL